MRRLQDKTSPRERSGRLNSLQHPALIVVGYLLIWLALSLVTEHVQGNLEVSLWYPPAGLSFVFLLIRGVRYAPAVVLTTLVQYLLHRGGTEYPLWLLLSLPIVYTAVYAGATVLLVGGIKIDPRLPRMRDLLYFVGIGCIGTPLVASAVAVTGYAVAGQVPWSGFAINVLGGAAGEATGVGVLTTLLLIAMRPFPHLWSFKAEEPLRGFSLPARNEILEVVGQALLLAATLFVAYGTERGVRLDFAYLVFLPLIWVALRSDLARTVVCILLINVAAVVLVSGPVEGTNPILIQFGLVTLTIVGVLLGGLVTERTETSARLACEASHDRLTGLPNRALFSDKLAHRSDDSSANSSNGGFAVLAVGLDRFANVNNALGHRTGDRLLVAVAERLRAFVTAAVDDSRAESTARVARTGEDVFAVLIDGARPDTEAGQVAERLLEELALPYELEGRQVHITASAGVVVVEDIPEESEETSGGPEDLLRDAHTALQEAWAKSLSSYVVFDQAMGEVIKARLALDADLRQAIEREELTLCYQPIYTLDTNRVVGAEALVRWEHPERGLLLPAEFIPIAEQGGLIVPIGEWVLREACRWTHEQQKRNPSQSPLTISVNLSATELKKPDYTEYLRTTLEETELDPRTLILEITESILVNGADSIGQTLDSIREEGVRLAIDDFGTGYSSLSYLSRFPVDIIKIDRSFISRLFEDGSVREISEGISADENLVSGIIDLAHGQNLTIIAEGVENTHQFERLRKTDCDLVQGYFFSEPLAGEKASVLIEST